MEKRSVCFFMLIHKRPAVARMSMWHMAKTIKKFNDAGYRSHGLVFGDMFLEPEQKDYALSLSLSFINIPNEPLADKFSTAYTVAMNQGSDYLCKMDSNNVNSDDYWERCMEMLDGKKVGYFGTKYFTVASADPQKQETCRFVTRRPYHVCASGQFYLSYTMKNHCEIHSLYKEDQRSNFDGAINQKLMGKFNDSIYRHVRDEKGTDCVDIKDGTDIHSYESYIERLVSKKDIENKFGADHPTYYPQEYTRDDLKDMFEEIRLLDEGYFDLPHDKTAEQGAAPSE